MNQELLLTKLGRITLFLKACNLCIPYLPTELQTHMQEMLSGSVQDMIDICKFTENKKMSNLPLGAELDERAPFNVNEKIYKFSVEITGDFYYEYQGTLDTDELEIANTIKGRIENLLLSQGDVDLDEISVGVH